MSPFGIALASALCAAGWASPAADPELPPEKDLQAALARIDRYAELRFQRMPHPAPEEIELGRLLFFDPRLSARRTMSCATCHVPEKAFSDGLPRAQPPGRPLLKRNTPSLLNVDDYHLFFWDGRVSRLEEQPLVPISSPEEMGSDLRELVVRLGAVPEYERRFGAVYGSKENGGISAVNIGRALAAFLRTLTTPPDSPFERFRDDRKALAPSAQRGLVLFAGKARCFVCHFSSSLTDHWFHQSAVRPSPGFDDLGRYAVVPDESTRWAFRTPSLRNVALTAPYMHDGSLKTLRDVVDFYDRGGDTAQQRHPEIRPIGLTEEEKRDLTAFLESLTSSVPRVERPRLPEDAPASARVPRLGPHAALPPPHAPAENEEDEPVFGPPLAGPTEPGCSDRFSLENLLRGMATGRYPSQTLQRLSHDVLDDAIWARIYAAMAANDAAPCAALRGLRRPVHMGIQASAEFYCEGQFYELAWIASFLTPRPDSELCRRTVDYNYRRLGPGDAAQVCSILLTYIEHPVEACQRLVPRFVPAYQPRSCRFILEQYAPSSYERCVALGDLDLGVPQRCRAFTDSIKARRAREPGLCLGNELCLAMAGEGVAAAASAEKTVREKVCAVLTAPGP